MIVPFLAILIVPVIVAVLAVKACWPRPGHAFVAVTLGLTMLGMTVATVGRIDETLAGGAATLCGALIAGAALVGVVRDAKHRSSI